MNSCKVCGSGSGRVHMVREMMYGTQDEFPYFECADCGCISLARIPENLDQYYQNSYYSFQQQSCSRVHVAAYRLSLSRFSFLTNLFPFAVFKMLHRIHLQPAMKLLDVGCGAGAMVAGLRKLGYSAEGIDPFVSSDIADEDGVRVRKGVLGEVRDKFDVILFLHSLEHMPVESLALARDRLNSDGLCVVRIPVVNWAWKRYGPNWVQLDAPRHLFVHSIRSFTILAERSGFKVQKMLFDSTDLQFWGSDGYARDIPLRSARPRLLKRSLLRLRAVAFNFRNLGDQAQFYLRRAD